ncbi:hypothetical protein [Brockia lithotrophica]|uniref:Uncharacterized protein n=1 Tax=Brockia lithotrophica TaxID=933949 RepID=A0A660L734_9BACL|nr:hypothetical protein [Brockia lithotrophica]RKQ88649.1 hypothetical protein C7438_0289 [Brockia lithotrophica]
MTDSRLVRLLVALGISGFGIGVVWGFHLDPPTLAAVAHALGERDAPTFVFSASSFGRTAMLLLGETLLLAWVGASVLLAPLLGLYFVGYAARLGFTLAFLYRTGLLHTGDVVFLFGLHGLSLLALAFGLAFTARFASFVVHNRLLRYRDPLRPELFRYALAWAGVFFFRLFLWWAIPQLLLSAPTSLAVPFGFAV